MILYLENGQQIRGDLIISAVLRTDLTPIPITLEAEIYTDDALEKQLAEGRCLTVGTGEALQIVKCVKLIHRAAQGVRERRAVRITALLAACHRLAFLKTRAILKENTSLLSLYRAAGATLKAVEADFPVSRLYCYAGETPTFQIARVLQEAGGVVRWKSGRLQFVRLNDLFRQKPVLDLPNNATQNITSGFLLRHEIPSFYSLNEAGGFIFGNEKASVRCYAHAKNVQVLQNMSHCLIQAETFKIPFSGQLAAGDLIRLVGEEETLRVIMTAAHVFESGTDEGGSSNTTTRLWLGRLS